MKQLLASIVTEAEALEQTAQNRVVSMVNTIKVAVLTVKVEYAAGGFIVGALVGHFLWR